jgi:flagellar assembly protein FliH
MNLLSDAEGTRSAVPVNGSIGAQTMSAFLASECSIAPFEFRSLTAEDAQEMMAALEPGKGNGNGLHAADHAVLNGRVDAFPGIGNDRPGREATIRTAIESARQEGLQAGERQGRRAAHAELEAGMNLSLARERQRVVEAVNQFRTVKDRYFTEIEQEVVKLALAIAARVLHREAQMDPLLLTGVVRVALEKMADRSGVVLRIAGEDVEAWERVFHATEASERPRVTEDARLERGECVLETKMGTVELGVHVQLEEIEKGFFDLLNHRPVE